MKKSRSTSRKTAGNEDEKLLIKRKADAAYTKWRYYKNKLHDGTPLRSRKTQKDGENRPSKDYLFYYETFRKPNGRLEHLYLYRKKHMVIATRRFAEYQNRLLQVLDKYGTNVDRERFKRLSEKEF